jgi:hypothetical protein
MARSVKRSQPLPAWEAGLPGDTVSTALSRRTPRSAHGVRSPVVGRGSARSFSSSRWMLQRRRAHACGTEKQSPTPVRRQGSCPRSRTSSDVSVERVEDVVGRRVKRRPATLGDRNDRSPAAGAVELVAEHREPASCIRGPLREPYAGQQGWHGAGGADANRGAP